MNNLIAFAAVAVCVVSAFPAIEDFPEQDDFLKHRRSLPDTEFEDVQLFQDELMRKSRSLSEADLQELPLEEEHGARLKRATCDALSFTSKWLTINHSACAIHCLTKGFKGGKCVNTICKCRK
ncbi:defensin-2 isoform X2 [Halyomorpha halys]|uniref:defensin-2 isoform X2 n=1 Tax=Halyomorpha halys TaxID=286706 RepID=UPI0034D173AC